MLKYSKIILTVVAAIWLADCYAQQNVEADKKAIQNTAQAYQEAFNQKDAAKLSQFWAPDAIYDNPISGKYAEGREAIEKLFNERFSQNQQSRVDITVKNIEFINENEALQNGIMKLTIPDQPAQKMAYQVEFVKENGKWLINAIKEAELQEAPSNFEHLKELSWLIGRWEDTDEDVEIIFNNQWDKYKNFITQQFEMKIFGQENIEGKQIIAWDPVNEVIRSWVFDSDGGFGEGVWKKVEKSWHEVMNYTLTDGREATSKNIYTPVDDQNYTFSSVDREVDGEILPNIDPVTVNKIAQEAK